MGKVRMVNPDV